MGGSADECVPILEYLSEAFRRRGVTGRDNYEIIIYEGAGHILEPPYGPVCTFAYVNVMDIVMALGGRLKEHAKAQEAAWGRILTFLKKHIGRDVNQGSRRQSDQPTKSKPETTRSKL
ncbi:acyl-coenzyme A amino acid N-acyltransferase 2-like [Patiria miniata]|uniref:BAAT/Acyl-CoA thioester hydrolase C-terminal domain-containing protein n=1 Tax=Patiria miniata TaxID=46514 RepID=A0A914BJN0_PATMI|nr:acyl-coenzyme A amino acid N-acyltransferase 2-like [Patiria miniata]